MVKTRFILEIESSYETAPVALLSAFIIGRVGGDPSTSGITGVSLTPCEPLSVAPHGEHGVADGIADGFRDSTAAIMDKLFDFGIAATRQPKERHTDCTCGMGIGAQPNAHFPKCLMYSGAITVVSDVVEINWPFGNGEAVDVADPKGNGKTAHD